MLGQIPLRRLFGLLLSGLVVLLASGCGGDRHGAAGVVTGVRESDFSICAPKRVPAGDVVLRVDNRGPDQHELIVVRAAGPELPLRTDGLTVNEEAVQRAEAGTLEPGAPGAVRDLRLHLAPGRYVLLCNMAGHYMGGMHADVVVT